MNRKLHEAMNHISDTHLLDAETYQKRRFPYWIAAAAAALALVIGLTLWLGGPGAPQEPLLDHTPTVAPTLPSAPRPTQPSMPAPTTPPVTAPTTPPATQAAPTEPPAASGESAFLAAAPTYPKTVLYPHREDYANYNDYRAALDAWSAFQGIQFILSF